MDTQQGPSNPSPQEIKAGSYERNSIFLLPCLNAGPGKERLPRVSCFLCYHLGRPWGIHLQMKDTELQQECRNSEGFWMQTSCHSRLCLC